MIRKAVEGYCRLSSADGSAWHLRRDQYGAIRTAWLKGSAFVDTFDIYDSPITIKLADVDSISDISPDAYLTAEAEEVVFP